MDRGRWVASVVACAVATVACHRSPGPRYEYEPTQTHTWTAGSPAPSEPAVPPASAPPPVGASAAGGVPEPVAAEPDAAPRDVIPAPIGGEAIPPRADPDAVPVPIHEAAPPPPPSVSPAAAEAPTPDDPPPPEPAPGRWYDAKPW